MTLVIVNKESPSYIYKEMLGMFAMGYQLH